MSIKAEGSTQFTFNIVENGADSAREKIVALQNAIDQLKNSAKSPINLNIALNKGAETLLKGLAKDALKAGQDVKKNFEKGLEGKESTSDKILKENQKRASKVVDDYIGDRKKEIAKTNNEIDDEYNKASKNIEAANNAVTQAQEAHNRLNEVFQDYDQGRASKDDIRNAAREAYARADSIVESYGDMLERRADGTKEVIDDIQLKAANALNDLYYDSDENRIGRGNRPDNWEDNFDIESYADSEAIARQKEQFLKAAQEQSDLNKAKVENLKQRKLQLEEQVEAANELKKQISQAKSVDEIQNSMKSIEGMSEFKPVKDRSKEKAKTETKAQEEKGLNLVGDLEKGQNDFVINVTAEGVETAKSSLESLNSFLSELKATAQDPIRLNVSMSEDAKKLFNGDKSLLEKYQQTGKELAQSMQQGLAEGVGKPGEGKKKAGASEFIDKYMDAEVKRSNDLQEKIAKKQQNFASKHAESLNKAFEKFENEAGLLSNQDLADAKTSKKSASAAQRFLELANSYTADEWAEFEKAMPGIQSNVEKQQAQAIEHLNKVSAAAKKSPDQDLQEVLSNVSSSALSDEELAKTIQANASKKQETRQSGKAYQDYFEQQAKMQEELALSAKNQAKAKRTSKKVDKSASDFETSNILKDFAESVNPSDQSIKTGIQSVSKNIQSKIGDALDSFNAAKMQGGDMTDFYQKMTESAVGTDKPIGSYLLDTFNKMNKFSDRDFDALAKNLQIADPEKFKDVSTNQLKQMRSVMGDMANEYSNVYAKGLKNVDAETVSAIESYQPSFNKALDKIYNQGSAGSSPSRNFGSRSLGSEYEKLVAAPNEVTTPTLDWKINIDPSPETILSQVEQIKSAITGLSSEGQTIHFESNLEEILAQVQSLKSEIESLSAQKADIAKTAESKPETEKKVETPDVEVQKTQKIDTPDASVTTTEKIVGQSGEVPEATTPLIKGSAGDIEGPTTAPEIKASGGQVEGPVKIPNAEIGEASTSNLKVNGDQKVELDAEIKNVEQPKEKLKVDDESIKPEIDLNAVQEAVSSQPVKLPVDVDPSAVRSSLENMSPVKIPVEPDLKDADLNNIGKESTKNGGQSAKSDLQKDLQKSVSQGFKDSIPNDFFNSAARDNIDNYKDTLAPLMQDKALKPLVDGLREEFGQRMSDPSILPSQDYGNALVDTVNKVLDKDLSSKLSKVQGKDDESVNTKRAKIIEDELSEARKQLRTLDKKYKIAGEDELLGSASSSGIASRYGFDPNNVNKKAFDGFGNAVADALVSKGYETQGFNVASDNKGKMATSFVNQGLQEKAAVQRIQYKDASGQDQFAFVKKPSSYSKSDQLTEDIYQPLVDGVVSNFQEMGAKFKDSSKYVQSEAISNLVKESQDLARSTTEAIVGDPTKTQKDLNAALNKIQKEQSKKFESLGKNLDLDGGKNPVLDVLDSDKFGWSNSLTGQDRRDVALKMIKSSLEAAGINPERLSIQSETNGAFRAQYAANNERINSTFKFDEIEGTNGKSVKISQGSIKRSENNLLLDDVRSQIYEAARQQIESMGESLRDSDKYLKSKDVDDVKKAGLSNLKEFLEKAAQDKEMTVGQADSEIKKIQGEVGSAYKALEKSLNKTGYLASLDEGFLDNLASKTGKERQRYVQATVEDILRQSGENPSNVKVKSENANGFTVQRIVDGQKKISTLQFDQYRNKNGDSQLAVRETAMQAEDIQGSWAKWGSNVAKKFKGLTEYLTSMFLAQQVFTEMAQGFEFVQSTDKALSNIAMTMDASDKQLAELKERSIQTGIDLKTDSKNVIQAATVYANASENASSILEKAKTTVLLSNASGQTTDVTSNQIQGIQNQFSDVGNDSYRVINSLEKISAGIALDFAEGIDSIAAGIQNAGSVASEAGLGFELFGSQIAKVAEVTRQDGSQIGNTLKTTMARISRSSSGDPNVTADERSNAAKAYKSVAGIDLYNNKGEYKDLSQTLDELAGKWDTLTDAEKNYISEESAGVRGLNTFKVMMDNYRDIQKLAREATEDSTFYQDVQEKWENSVEGKKAGLTAQEQQFWDSMISSGTIGGAYDLASVGVSMANGFISTLKTGFDKVNFMMPNGDFKNGISTLATMGITGGLGVGAFDFMKGLPEASRSGKPGAYTELFKDSFRPFVSTAQELGTWSKTGYNSLKQFVSGLKDASKQTGSFGDTIKDAWKSTDLKKAWENAKNYGKALEGLKGSELAKKKEELANIAPQSMAGKTVAWANQHPTASAAIAGLATVGTIASIVATAVSKTEEARQAKLEKAQTAQQEYNKASQSVGQFRKYIEDNLEEYKQLSRGVNKATNENVSLSDADYQKYLDFVNQVAQMAPSTFSRYDKNGNAILRTKDDSSILTALRQEEMKVAQQAVNNMKDYSQAWDAANNKQGTLDGLFDWSDNMYGTMDQRKKIAQWAMQGTLEDIQNLGKKRGFFDLSPGGKSGFTQAAQEGGFIMPEETAKAFLEKASGMKIGDLNEETFASFVRNLQSAVSDLEASQESYVAPFRDSMVEMLNQQRTEEASKYPYQTDKDWDNLTSLLSGTSSDRLIDMLTEDPTGGLVEQYTNDWIEAMKIGGREFSDALDSVLSLSADSSVKEMEKALDETLPVLTKNLSKDAADGLEESLNLEDYRKVVGQYNDLKYGLFDGTLNPDYKPRHVSTKETYDTERATALAKDLANVQKMNDFKDVNGPEKMASAISKAFEGNLSQVQEKMTQAREKREAEPSFPWLNAAKEQFKDLGSIFGESVANVQKEKRLRQEGEAIRQKSVAPDSYQKGSLSDQQQKSLASLLDRMDQQFTNGFAQKIAKQRIAPESYEQIAPLENIGKELSGFTKTVGKTVEDVQAIQKLQRQGEAIRQKSIAPDSYQQIDPLEKISKTLNGFDTVVAKSVESGQEIVKLQRQGKLDSQKSIAPDSYDQKELTEQQQKNLSEAVKRIGTEISNQAQREALRKRTDLPTEGITGANAFDVEAIKARQNRKVLPYSPIYDPKTIKAIQERSMSDRPEERGMSNTDTLLKAISSEVKDGVRFFGNDMKLQSKIEKNTGLTAKEQDKIIRSFDDFIDRNNINSLEGLNQARDILSKLAKENPNNIDWDRAQSLWDISGINLSRFQSQLDALRSNVEVFGENLDNIDKARMQSVSTSGMGNEQLGNMKALFQGIEGFDYDKLFESTALGIHMNTTELERLTGAYRDSQMKEYQKQIDDMTSAWQSLSQEINNTEKGTQKYNNLIAQRDNVAKQIQEAREIQSMFEGYNNPVSMYMRALQNPEEGDTYDLLGGDNGYKKAKELYDKGLVGTEKFKKFAQMLTNEDLTGQDIEKYVEAYEARAANFAAIFNEDGIQGVGNALNLLRNAGLIKKNDDDESEYNEYLDGTVRDFAEALQVSDAAASVFMKKLSDFGIDISFAEETDNLKNLRHEAEAAAESLTETGKSFGIETNKKDATEVEQQLQKIKKAKEEIKNTDYEGHQQDLERLDTLQKYYETLQGAQAIAMNDTRTNEGRQVAQEKLDKFNEKAETQIEIDWSTDRVDDLDSAIERVKSSVDALSGEKATLEVDAQGYEEARALLEQLIQQKHTLEQPAILGFEPDQTTHDSTTEMIDGYKNMASAVQKVRDLQELENNGIQLKTDELKTAQEGVKTAWSQFQNSRTYESLFKPDGKRKQDQAAAIQNAETFGFNLDPSSENFIDQVEALVNSDNSIEFIAELTGDENLQKQIRDITDQKYDVEVDAVLKDKDKSLNRVMNDAYGDDPRTQHFDYDVLDRGTLMDMGASTSEVQVIARFVADPGSLATITSDEDKTIICNYIQGTDIPDVSQEEKDIVCNYITNGTVPEGYTEDQVQEIQQTIVRQLGEDHSKDEVDSKDQTINRKIGDDESKKDPEVKTQTINREIGSDPSAIAPAAVTQIVNREVHESTISSGGSSGGGSSGGAKGAAQTVKLHGTAHVEGTAKPSLWNRIKEKGKAFVNGFRGKWGLPHDETALVGEQSPEIIVRNKTGEWELAGQHGAEFANLHRGDIVFNGLQSKQLLENGYVTANGGRGRMIGGPAHVEGSYKSGGLRFFGGASVLNNPQPVVQQAAPAPQVEKQVEKVVEKAKKEEEKLFDWIEIRLDRITRKIEDLDKTASSAFHTFADRAKDYTAEYDKIIEKMDVTEQAIKKYQEEADKVGLDAAYVEKVKNGAIEIENITDEELNEKITKYQEFYNKILDLQYGLTDLKEALAEIEQSKFQLVATEFDHLVEKIQYTTDVYEKQISIIEARGQFAGRSYYGKLIENEQKKADELEKKYQALIKAREEALKSGRIAEGSEADLDMQDQINQVSLAWMDATESIEKYRTAIYQAEKDVFDFMQDQVSLLSEETEFLREIMNIGENDLFVKDVGTLNDKGKATLALAATNLDVLMRQAQQTKAMIDHIDSQIASDPTNKVLMENRADLIRQQRELIKGAVAEKKAILSLVKESYQRMLESLSELIEKRKSLLQSTKDC